MTICNAVRNNYLRWGETSECAIAFTASEWPALPLRQQGSCATPALKIDPFRSPG
jgi:hypothetical protein